MRVRRLVSAAALLGILAIPAAGMPVAAEPPSDTPGVTSQYDDKTAGLDKDCDEPRRVSSISALDVRIAAPLGLGSCPGVRPGGVVHSEQGRCSLNFVFRGSDGRRYIGTAGHCILPEGSGERQERVWAPGTGPWAWDAAGNRFGEFAYAMLDPRPTTPERDIALIRIDPGVHVSPQMCHFGGPTGMNHDRPSLPTLLHHYGFGTGFGDITPGRTAVALTMQDPDEVWATGLALFGDSGSGVITADGRAVGVLVAIGGGASSAYPFVNANIRVTRFGPQLHEARLALGLGWLALETAPLL